MRKTLASLATAAIASVGMVAYAPAASADTPGCVTIEEHRRIKDGMSKPQVHRIYDTSGRLESRSQGSITREYRTCAGDPDWSYASVDYEMRNGVWRVWFKWIYIS